MKSYKIINAVKTEYSSRRERAQIIADSNYEFALSNREFASIISEIASLNFSVAEKQFKKQDVTAETEQLNVLNKKRVACLNKMKLSDTDFIPKSICTKCNDTGYVNGRFCDCFVKRYYEVLRSTLGIAELLDFSFEDADFSQIKNNRQREYLQKLYGVFEKYCNKFPKVNTKNALITGGTGVGKSYLMTAVGNCLQKRGFGVIYVSAVQLDKLMLLYHTAPSSERNIYLDDVIDCDMLIIDDLGSEQKIRNVTEEYLLLLLNEREMNGKPVFITSNLSQEELKASYNERLFSRMANKKNTIIKEIIGVDLRLN